MFFTTEEYRAIEAMALRGTENLFPGLGSNVEKSRAYEEALSGLEKKGIYVGKQITELAGLPVWMIKRYASAEKKYMINTMRFAETGEGRYIVFVLYTRGKKGVDMSLVTGEYLKKYIMSGYEFLSSDETSETEGKKYKKKSLVKELEKVKYDSAVLYREIRGKELEKEYLYRSRNGVSEKYNTITEMTEKTEEKNLYEEIIRGAGINGYNR